MKYAATAAEVCQKCSLRKMCRWGLCARAQRSGSISYVGCFAAAEMRHRMCGVALCGRSDLMTEVMDVFRVAHENDAFFKHTHTHTSIYRTRDTVAHRTLLTLVSVVVVMLSCSLRCTAICASLSLCACARRAAFGPCRRRKCIHRFDSATSCRTGRQWRRRASHGRPHFSPMSSAAGCQQSVVSSISTRAHKHLGQNELNSTARTHTQCPVNFLRHRQRLLRSASTQPE